MAAPFRVANTRAWTAQADEVDTTCCNGIAFRAFRHAAPDRVPRSLPGGPVSEPFAGCCPWWRGVHFRLIVGPTELIAQCLNVDVRAGSHDQSRFDAIDRDPTRRKVCGKAIHPLGRGTRNLDRTLCSTANPMSWKLACGREWRNAPHCAACTSDSPDCIIADMKVARLPGSLRSAGLNPYEQGPGSPTCVYARHGDLRTGLAGDAACDSLRGDLACQAGHILSDSC